MCTHLIVYTSNFYPLTLLLTMADIIVSALLNTIFEKLATEAVNQFVRSQGIHSELQNLGRKLSQIQAVLIDASHKEISDEAVKLWLNNLQHLAYDIDDVLDDFATEEMHRELTHESTSKVRKLIPTCCTNFSLSTRLRHKLDDITTELQDLENRKLGLGLMVKGETPKNMSRRNETSLPDVISIIGRHSDKEKYMQKLLGGERCDQNFSIVPIVGMGGVGKTTLARLLYNETEVNDHFNIQAWVCVSDEVDTFKISQTIFRAMTRETKKFENLNEVQIALKEQLKDKRFLLVLDDVWSESYDDWENLVRPCHGGAPGSRIIMTTRKEQLLKKLGFDNLVHIERLSHEDALSLFAQHALGVDNFDSHPLKPQGEGIVKKCGGLPLALKALGRLLRTKKDKEDWDVVLNSEIWDLENVDDIIPALRLSYQDLPASLKQLFAYCSLFPKDFLFDKEELVLLWMAEGYLNQTPANMSLESLGHEHFEKLLSRSFFQHAPNDKSLFVMHDLINDLATFVARDFFLRFDNRMDIANKTIEKCRHMSFIREEYVAYPKFEPFRKAKSLRTLLGVSCDVVNPIYDSFHLSNKLLFDLLPNIPLLRVLCLNWFEIREVPEFIGSLKHLRYLNLSKTKIKKLPENVGNLYNLQTLIVFGCWKLTKLPKSFTNLKNLRHFDIRDTPLLKIPLGIGELKSLQTLTKIIIGGNKGFAITELNQLPNLHGEISIEGLHKVQSAKHAHEANLSQKQFTMLQLKWGDAIDVPRRETLEKDVLTKLKPCSDKLERLGIESYWGGEFPKWVGDPLFLCLVDVSLQGCRKCLSLPPLGQLPSLKKLVIQGMNEVKVVGLELLGNTNTGVAFRSLEILEFEDMSGWEVWSTNNEVVDVVFPFLRELSIKNCPSLVDLSLNVLPLLRVLKIGGCGDGVLTCMVQVASSITMLEVHSISGLTDAVWRDVTEYLSTVEEVKIESCDQIRYLWESEAKASMVLKNLRKLKVSQCEGLVSLGEKEYDDNFGSNVLTSLTMLDISICSNMENCICPNNIESLRLFVCNSLTFVSFQTGGGQKLKSLDLFECDKLMEKMNTSMPMLEYLDVYLWPNLKSITELSNFSHLTRLKVYDCQSLESFPDLLLLNLMSLKHLIIVNCPSMDASFPRGLWPPKLRILEIGTLKKPISQWGSQNFPTSLVELTLYGESVSDFSQVSHLLPSCLTLLHILEFERLESLSVGLQHLNSLQHLIIHDCPKLKDLPETLLPSLLRLVIFMCPSLRKRSKGKGSFYWPRISHIPFIGISGGLFDLL